MKYKKSNYDMVRDIFEGKSTREVSARYGVSAAVCRRKVSHIIKKSMDRMMKFYIHGQSGYVFDPYTGPSYITPTIRCLPALKGYLLGPVNDYEEWHKLISGKKNFEKIA